MEILNSLWQIFINLGELIVGLLTLGLHWFALVAWVAWWLWGVNWQKLWPVLARGAWLPLVLLMVLAAAAWSGLSPTDCDCLGFVSVPTFWWQLGAVGLLMAFTLFCGWLQGVLGWAPEEIDLEPPAPAVHGHGH